jgi:small subunit ribosomal protein S5
MDASRLWLKLPERVAWNFSLIAPEMAAMAVGELSSPHITQAVGRHERERMSKLARGDSRDRGGRDQGRGRDEREPEFLDKLVHINRVAKVVKGGKRFGFAALVVVGDQKGRVGFGHGKAREVPEAIRKATEQARNTLIRVPLREGRTLHHDVAGRHGAGKVIMRAAPPGTGIIAGGPMRAVFEMLGVQDVVAKSIGTSNAYNMIRATFDALKREDSPRSVAARRGLKVSEIVGRRRDGVSEVATPQEG